MKLTQLTDREKGILALISLAFIWGIIPLLPRFLSTSFDFFQQIYLRIFVGAIGLFFIFRKSIDTKKLLKLPLKEYQLLFVRSFIYYFLGVGMYTFAVLTTKVSNVVFISAVPMTAILGFLILREKATAQKIFFVVLSMVGVLTLSIKDYQLSSIGLGELFALLSAFFISLGLISRRWQAKLLNDYEMAFLMLIFASVQLLVASFIRGEGLPITGWSSEIFIVLFIAGLCNSGISFFMNYGFARVDAVLASNITSLSLVFASILAFLFFHELPNIREFIGGLIIIISTVLLHQAEKSNR